MGKQESKRESVCYDLRKTPHFVVGFEDEKRPRAKECREPLEAGKGREMDFPLDNLPERNAVLLVP